MLHSPSLNPIAAPLSRWQMVPISKSKIGNCAAWQSYPATGEVVGLDVTISGTL
jgi:hypothetical protein